MTGEEGTSPLEICGCYMIRGQTMEPLVRSGVRGGQRCHVADPPARPHSHQHVANDDAYVYFWNKVDTTTDEGKAHVKEMWCYDIAKYSSGEPIFVEGKEVNDVKQFK